MKTTTQIAKHLRDVHFGGNWTSVNMRDTLAGVNWKQATANISSLNTIGHLAYHIHYYCAAVIKVLEGGPLDAHDKYSFNLPPIESERDWQNLLQQVWDDAEKLAVLIERLAENTLEDNFTDPKYGTYHRNLLGLIEHTHYHLGQIVLIRKLLNEGAI